MNNPYLMTGSTYYLHPADDSEENDRSPSASLVRADLVRIEDLLSNGKYDSVPGIDSLRSELHRVERLQTAEA